MVRKGLFLVMGAVLAVLFLLPGIALADEVELPAKTVFMGGWDLIDTGGVYGPQPGLISRVDAYYAAHPHIYYRVLIHPNGTEEVIDSYKFVFGETGTHYQQYPRHIRTRIWAEGEIPANTIEVSEPGDYSVELRHIDIPKPTAVKFPEADLNSVVDWYVVERVEEADPGYDKTCVRAVGWVCWREIKVEGGVKVSDYAQVYETYSFTVESLPTLPSLTGGTGTPFSSSSGKDGPASAGALPLVAIGLVGAGMVALASRKVKITTVLSSHGAAIEAVAAANKSLTGRIRARYKAWLRFMYWGKKWGRVRKQEAAERRRNEGAMMREMANIERMYTNEQKATALTAMVNKRRGNMRKKYETKLTRFEEEFLEGPPPKKVRRDVAKRRRNERLLEIEMNNWERMYTIEQKAAALREMKRKYKGKVRKKFEREIERLEKGVRRTSARDYKVVHAKSFTPGPTAVLSSAPVNLVPIEESVDKGLFNFLEALRLKEDYGYSLSEGLGFAYENNPLVRSMGNTVERVHETQTRAIEAADKSPIGLSAARKFAHGFTREIGMAVPSLIANTWFAAGATAVTIYDSIRHPEDAVENFKMLGTGAVVAVINGVRGIKRTITEEDPAVAAGAMAAFFIAPEEGLGWNAVGRISRVSSKVSRRAGKGVRAGRVVRRGKMSVKEKAAMKSFEHAEGIAEHVVERGEKVSGLSDNLRTGTETFIDVAEPNKLEEH